MKPEDADLPDSEEGPNASEHEDSEPDIELFFDRSTFTDPRTRRERQILICR